MPRCRHGRTSPRPCHSWRRTSPRHCVRRKSARRDAAAGSAWHRADRGWRKHERRASSRTGRSPPCSRRASGRQPCARSADTARTENRPWRESCGCAGSFRTAAAPRAFSSAARPHRMRHPPARPPPTPHTTTTFPRQRPGQVSPVQRKPSPTLLRCTRAP